MTFEPYRYAGVVSAAFGIGWIAVLGLPAGASAGEAPAQGEPAVWRISENTVLDPRRVYGAIEIAASDITVDGRGATVLGTAEGVPREYTGTAITANGVSGVVLRNIRARGWETGLHITDGAGWKIEGCDFSDNFHDPDFGWGENGRRGGMVLTRVRDSAIRKNRANRVWDACVLVESDGNILEENDFSHTSNTCLKLWRSSGNRVSRNALRYGLRISPGEVHARDSACVLIETASNDNRFSDNDCTHGGDGIFVRVLNGVVSTGNLFEGNDCSYANNNGFEAWSPRNRYVGNTANHCSYGFWLGASDQTVLIGNRASFNGLPEGFHNSPHLPDAGHAGIVFMFGPSSHTVVRDNTCVGNNGAGIALIGDLAEEGPAWKAFHWIIEKNRLENNRWGIYAHRADWIDMAANRFAGNTAADVQADDSVTNLFRRTERKGISDAPTARYAGPARATVGETVTFDASASQDPGGHPLQFRWDVGDGTVSAEPIVRHVYATPGFKRVGLTVSNGVFADLAWQDLYVVEPVTEVGTDGEADRWGWIDPTSQVVFANDPEESILGAASLRAVVNPYGGGRVSLLYPASRDARIEAAGMKELSFWVRAVNENVPAWQGPNPVVTLYGPGDETRVLTPADDLMSRRRNNEEREGWTYFSVPLEGDAMWVAEGPLPAVITALTIGFDSWGAPPLTIRIDGLSFR